MPLYQLGSKKPKVHPTAVIAPNATIIGDVVVGSRTSVWPGAVLRGDYGRIRVGANCSLQDNVVVHCSSQNPAVIGNGVTVAHEGRTIPPRSVAVGAPAKVMRRATDKDVRMIRESYRAYVKMAEKYTRTEAFTHSIG